MQTLSLFDVDGMSGGDAESFCTRLDQLVSTINQLFTMEAEEQKKCCDNSKSTVAFSGERQQVFNEERRIGERRRAEEEKGR